MMKKDILTYNDFNQLVIRIIQNLNNFMKERDDKSFLKTNSRISRILHQKRYNEKTCNLYKQIGIKFLGDNNFFDKMLDWEIEYYFNHHSTDSKHHLNER